MFSEQNLRVAPPPIRPLSPVQTGVSRPLISHVRGRDLSDSPVDPATAIFTEAARIIAAGGVIVLPTDTLYGLAADPWNATAVERLFQIKQRPAEKPIPLLISDREMLRRVVLEVTPEAERLMDAFWPGPLTLIFKGTALPERLTAGTGTIAIRLPDSPFLIRLITAMGRPITATSANRSGGADLHSAQAILAVLGGAVDLIIDGGLRAGFPSTLVDVAGPVPTLVRPGAIPASSLSPYISSSSASL